MTDFAPNGSERSSALFGLWRRVNEIAEATEDETLIRKLLAEAGFTGEPMHIGVDPDAFTPEMVAEWALSNWAHIIDMGRLDLLNSCRNISIDQYEQTVKKLEATDG